MGITRLNAPDAHPNNIPLNPRKKPSRGRPKFQREKVDRGTLELHAKKKILVGKARKSLQDLSQTLHLLYHRKAVTPSQLEAGQSYKLLWEEVQRFLGIFSLDRSSLAFFGQIKTAYCPWDLPDQTSENKEHFLKQWDRIQYLLNKEGGQIQQVVHRVVVQNYITPEMIQEDVFPPLELFQLRKGLNRLGKYFRSS